jgi:hypothetical protein
MQTTKTNCAYLRTIAEREAQRHGKQAALHYRRVLRMIDDAVNPRLSQRQAALLEIKRRRGVIIFRGRSPVDGAPILVALQRSSSNRKTGEVLQTYILRSDVSPIDALRDGRDRSACGDCLHRPNKETGERSCYVDLRSLQAVWNSINASVIMTTDKRGRRVESKRKRDESKNYIELSEAAAMLGVGEREALRLIGAGESIRLGTYGDPAMMPAYLWRSLLIDANWNAGYTHQWREAWAAEHRAFLMASCDSAADVNLANASGWRTFTVVPNDGQHRRRAGDLAAVVRAPVALCPASYQAGQKVTCSSCPIGCNGADGASPIRHVYIPAHGPVTSTRAHKNSARKNWAEVESK